MDILNFTAPGKNNRTNAAASTQMHLRVGEIRDNSLILKNGGMRIILKTSSINFNLKSEEEQNAIINAYQGFLNSLEFPIQILVRSKKLDIDDYIEGVEKLAEKQTNPLLQDQTYEYAQYIRKLIEYVDIMEKEFYVIVPYDPAGTESQSLIQSFIQRLTPKDTLGDIKKREGQFSNLKKGVSQRVNIVKSGLEQCGLKVEQLDTKELIELFYNSYNPTVSRNAKVKKLDELTIEKSEDEPEQDSEISAGQQ